MSIEKHTISVGDTLTPLGVQLKQEDVNGDLVAVDLIGLTVKFSMSSSAGTVIVDESTTGVTVTEAASGLVQYDFQTADVATAGLYYGWFTVYSGTEFDTYPAGNLKLVIEIVTPGSAVNWMASSYFSLVERVGHFLFGMRSGFSDDQTSDIEMVIGDGLRRVYTAHQWSFFRPVKTITTASGTATYSLPTGYESIETELHYAPGESDFYPPVRQRHDSEILKLQADNDDAAYDRPRYFSVRTVEFDATVGSRKQLVLWPTPDATYVLYARLTLRPTMIDSVNQYPIGGEQLAQVILEACLSSAELNMDDKDGLHGKQFAELLPFAIQADLLSSSPRTLGSDRPDGEPKSDLEALKIQIGTISINGTTM